MVARQPSKLKAAGSIPVARFASLRLRFTPSGAKRSVGSKGAHVESAVPRGVAQSGSALGWGPSGRWFKSSRPDSLEARLGSGLWLNIRSRWQEQAGRPVIVHAEPAS